MKEFFFLLLSLLSLLPVYSIDSHWDLEPVVIKNGVSNNTIYNVCYGSDGFIWLSTDREFHVMMDLDFVIILSL